MKKTLANSEFKKEYYKLKVHPAGHEQAIFGLALHIAEWLHSQLCLVASLLYLLSV